MNWLTPNIVLWISLGLIIIGLGYKWFERKILKKMHTSPELFDGIGEGYRLRYQQVYGTKSNNKHLHFFEKKGNTR